MKNNSIFVVSTPKTIYAILAVAAIFFATCMVYRTTSKHETGYQIPANYCTAKSVIVFGETGGDSLFCTHISFFHSQMPKTMKNARTVNNSSCTATFTHETSQSFYSNYLHEMQLKNRAYAFIIDSGLITEFTEFSHTYNHSGDNSSARIALILKGH